MGVPAPYYIGRFATDRANYETEPISPVNSRMIHAAQTQNERFYRMENTAVSRTPWRIQQYREGGRGHNSCRPRRTLPSPPPSKQENTAVPSGTEVAQRYRTPYDHTLDSTVQTRENSSIYLEERRGHHSTGPRTTIPSTPPSKLEKTAVSRGKEGAPQYQTP